MWVCENFSMFSMIFLWAPNFSIGNHRNNVKSLFFRSARAMIWLVCLDGELRLTTTVSVDISNLFLHKYFKAQYRSLAPRLNPQSANIVQLLDKYETASTKMLDRWSIMIFERDISFRRGMSISQSPDAILWYLQVILHILMRRHEHC